MRIKFISFVLISLFLIMPHLIHAQFSLKPKPLPDCKTFLITEMGYFYRISSSPEGISNNPHYYVSNCGFMVNLSNKLALGATSHVGMHKHGNFRLGVKARGRRWLGLKNSVDLETGVIFWDSYSVYKSPAFSGGLCLNISDLLIAELLVEITPYDFVRRDYTDYTLRNGERIYTTTHYRGSDLAIYTGIKTGWTPGFILNAAAVTAGTILLGLWVLLGGD